MDKRPFTCCFTGHRNLPAEQEKGVWRRVYACLEPLLKEGVALLWRGRRAGFRHAGGGKTAGAAEESTPDTHHPGAARLPKPLDTRAAGPCGGGGGEGR